VKCAEDKRSSFEDSPASCDSLPSNRPFDLISVFSVAFNLCYPLRVRYQVLHPYRPAGGVRVLYIAVKVKFSRYRPEQALGDPVG
jgi:hypothetical protein